MKKSLLVAIAFLLTPFCQGLVAGQGSKVINGGFEAGLQGWQATGDVHLETNSPLDGKASAIIGPGAGSLTQRIKTGSGNAPTLSATIQSQRSFEEAPPCRRLNASRLVAMNIVRSINTAF
jgi:hypothetical protein